LADLENFDFMEPSELKGNMFLRILSVIIVVLAIVAYKFIGNWILVCHAAAGIIAFLLVKQEPARGGFLRALGLFTALTILGFASLIFILYNHEEMRLERRYWWLC
jgi:hypothetical protein